MPRHRLLLAFVLAGLSQASLAAPIRAKVIYGTDDRKDLYEVSDARLALADATVAMVRANELKKDGDQYRLVTVPFGQVEALCTSERFYSQGIAADCSGFLVNEDTIVTAGHCISTPSQCSSARFIFGFAMHASDQTTWRFPSSQIYRCDHVVHSVTSSNGEDFAVVKLDRAVKDHKPLTYRTSGVPARGTKLVVMGHPSGLPLKIADNASVREVTDNYFVANLDTYGGNSGSAVMDATTGMVEGILVRGERDYILKDNCYISLVCADSSCRGEDATPITKVIPYL